MELLGPGFMSTDPVLGKTTHWHVLLPINFSCWLETPKISDHCALFTITKSTNSLTLSRTIYSFICSVRCRNLWDQKEMLGNLASPLPTPWESQVSLCPDFSIQIHSYLSLPKLQQSLPLIKKNKSSLE